jgi:hypothetical protein
MWFFYQQLNYVSRSRTNQDFTSPKCKKSIAADVVLGLVGDLIAEIAGEDFLPGLARGLAAVVDEEALSTLPPTSVTLVLMR